MGSQKLVEYSVFFDQVDSLLFFDKISVNYQLDEVKEFLQRAPLSLSNSESWGESWLSLDDESRFWSVSGLNLFQEASPIGELLYLDILKLSLPRKLLVTFYHLIELLCLDFSIRQWVFEEPLNNVKFGFSTQNLRLTENLFHKITKIVLGIIVTNF